MEGVAFLALGRAGQELGPIGHDDLDRVVFGMDVGLHGFNPAASVTDRRLGAQTLKRLAAPESGRPPSIPARAGEQDGAQAGCRKPKQFSFSLGAAYIGAMTQVPHNDAARARRAPSDSLRALAPILPYARRRKGWIFAALAALTVASAATLAMPLAVRGMIDKGFAHDHLAAINSYFVILIGVVALLALASAARYFLVMSLGERIVADLRDDVFAHMTRLDPAFYDQAQTGELVSRLTADTTQIKAAFGSSASVALRNLFMFVGAIGLMIYTSPKLSAVVLVAIPVIVVPLVAGGRSVRGRSRAAQDVLGDASAFAAENLCGVAHHAGLWRRSRLDPAFRRRRRRRLSRRPRRDQGAGAAHRLRHFPGVLQRGRGAVARGARRARRPHHRRPAFAIRALRRAGRQRPGAIVGSVERNLRRSRRRRPHRRNTGRAAADRRAGRIRKKCRSRRAAKSPSIA